MPQPVKLPEDPREAWRLVLAASLHGRNAASRASGNWRRSSSCSTEACVWVHVRDDGCVEMGHEPGDPRPQVYQPREWSEFVAGVKAGEFGKPVTENKS